MHNRLLYRNTPETCMSNRLYDLGFYMIATKLLYDFVGLWFYNCESYSDLATDNFVVGWILIDIKCILLYR